MTGEEEQDESNLSHLSSKQHAKLPPKKIRQRIENDNHRLVDKRNDAIQQAYVQAPPRSFSNNQTGFSPGSTKKTVSAKRQTSKNAYETGLNSDFARQANTSSYSNSNIK